MSGQGCDSSELEEIDKGDLAAEILLEPRLHFSDGEGMSAEIEEVIGEADTGHAESFAPGAGDDLLHFGAGFAGPFGCLSGEIGPVSYTHLAVAGEAMVGQALSGSIQNFWCSKG